MMEIGITLSIASCFVPGMTFHGIRTPSWDSRSSNSAIVERFSRLMMMMMMMMMLGELMDSGVYTLSRVFHRS